MTSAGSDLSTRIAGLLHQTLDHESLFARLRQGHVLVTANSRLKRDLEEKYSHWRMAAGEQSWPSPNIIAWTAWLDRLWEQAVLQGAVENGHAVPGKQQLLCLWQQALKNARVSPGVLQPPSLAAQLRDTRELIKDWQINLKDPSWFFGDSENHGAFYQWNQAFERLCEKGGWLPPQDRLAQLALSLKSHRLAIPGPLDLLGFDEFTPAQKTLLLNARDAGLELTTLQIESRQGNSRLLKCRDSDEELERALRWARHLHETEPTASIAIVVPDLQTRRAEVERRLADILTPGAVTAPHGAWNMSMGQPLLNLPMVVTAFDLFGLLDGHTDIQAIGRVLRSPWLAGAGEERYKRALLEKRLREKHDRQLTLFSVQLRARELKKYDAEHKPLPEDQWHEEPWNCPELATVMDRLMRFAREESKPRPASTWANDLGQLLSNLGWPAADSKSLEADDYQALQSWRDAWRELASLDATTARLSRQAALGQLRQICLEQVFQPRTPPARIQVLGLYEANSLRFDHLWVLGLHAGNWPASARPNPFIPYKLQREAQCPNASPQRELAVAQAITRRLRDAAPDCVFSYPGQLDGEDQFPSPLLTEAGESLAGDMVPAWNGAEWRGVVAAADKPTKGAIGQPGTLVHALARGGSSILKHQALCPFRAFANNRLGAEPLEVPSDGVDAIEHGQLVHKALETFWEETKTQANLLQLDETAQDERVRHHVEAAIKKRGALRDRPALRAVEAQRIHQHLQVYLQLEKDRSPFEVSGLEQEVQVDIAGQPIRLYIDRVDQLPGGEKVIIDYKTGPMNPRHWFGDRPEEPQLPLYAINAGGATAAVAFGIIRDDECRFRGVVKGEGILPGLPPKATVTTQYLVDAGADLPATIEDWQQVLETLMRDFLAGNAAIDPKAGSTTCTNSYCKLQSLCRLSELQQLAAQDGNGGEQ